MELFITEYGWVFTTVGVYYIMNIGMLVLAGIAKMGDM